MIHNLIYGVFIKGPKWFDLLGTSIRFAQVLNGLEIPIIPGKCIAGSIDPKGSVLVVIATFRTYQR